MINHKLLFAIAGFLVYGNMAVAQATDDTGADSTTQPQNLVYYPHQGQFLLTPSVAASLQDGNKVYDSGGIQTTYSNDSTESVSATLAYGVFDRLRVALSETWLIGNKSSSTNLTKGTVTTEGSTGPSNPTLNATYRYLQPRSGDGIHADVSLNISPSIGTKDAATATGQSGNDNGGAWDTTLTLPIYWVYGRNELGGSLSVTHNFGGVANGTESSNTLSTEPYWSESFTVEDRFHFTRSFYLEPIVVFNFPYSYNSAAQDANATAHSVNFAISPELNFGYLINHRWLIDLTIASTSTVSNAYPTSGKNTETDAQELLATLQARFIF
jgi:hypothetical protein